MLRALVVAIAVLMAVGCGAPAQEPEAAPVAPLDAELRISVEFTAAERQEIDAAIAEWYVATGGSVRFGLVPSPGAEPWGIERRDAPACGEIETWMGCTRALERRVDLNVWGIYPVDEPAFDLVGWGVLRRVTLHELGHALGLEDGASPLMRRGGEPCIDSETLTVACELRGCAEMRPTCE
jgi:hypothetical protein